jgi:hypothetical protein
MGEKVAHNHPLRADLSSTKRLDRTVPICTLAAEPGAGMPKQRKKPAGQAAAATTMTAAEAVIATLIGHGLDTIYALPGVQNDFLFEALFGASDRLRTIHTRHEAGAAYMALGAALATGKPQAYAVVPGPGAAQCRGGAAHRVCHQCSGARPDRANSRRRYRPQSRPSS